LDTPADFTLSQTEHGPTAVLTGDWTAVAMAGAGDRLADALSSRQDVRLDMTHLGRCDTAGAFAIMRATEGRLAHDGIHAPSRAARLMELVGRGMRAEPVPH